MQQAEAECVYLAIYPDGYKRNMNSPD